MRKTKENSAMPPKQGASESREAQETENEEHSDAIGGTSATDGVGSGYDTDGADPSEADKAEAGADGPLSGDIFDPSASNPLKKKRTGNIRSLDSRDAHAAANSPKTI